MPKNPKTNPPTSKEEDGGFTSELINQMGSVATMLGYTAKSPKTRVLGSILRRMKPEYGGDVNAAAEALKRQIAGGDKPQKIKEIEQAKKQDSNRSEPEPPDAPESTSDGDSMSTATPPGPSRGLS